MIYHVWSHVSNRIYISGKASMSLVEKNMSFPGVTHKKTSSSTHVAKTLCPLHFPVCAKYHIFTFAELLQNICRHQGFCQDGAFEIFCLENGAREVSTFQIRLNSWKLWTGNALRCWWTVIFHLSRTGKAIQRCFDWQININIKYIYINIYLNIHIIGICIFLGGVSRQNTATVDSLFPILFLVQLRKLLCSKSKGTCHNFWLKVKCGP